MTSVTGPTLADLSAGIVRLPLGGRRGFMQVDVADAPMLARYRWRMITNGTTRYAATGLPGHPTVGAHRLIMCARPGQLVDHINGDGLDNRRANLRICTNAQNTKGKHRHVNSPYRFKGIYLKRGRIWWAKLVSDGRQYNRGPFATDEDAARAYDALAREHHGEWARLNFPDVLTDTAGRPAGA